jgi:hypothetical protein
MAAAAAPEIEATEPAVMHRGIGEWRGRILVDNAGERTASSRRSPRRSGHLHSREGCFGAVGKMIGGAMG